MEPKERIVNIKVGATPDPDEGVNLPPELAGRMADVLSQIILGQEEDPDAKAMREFEEAYQAKLGGNPKFGFHKIIVPRETDSLRVPVYTRILEIVATSNGTVAIHYIAPVESTWYGTIPICMLGMDAEIDGQFLLNMGYEGTVTLGTGECVHVFVGPIDRDKPGA